MQDPTDKALYDSLLKNEYERNYLASNNPVGLALFFKFLVSGIIQRLFGSANSNQLGIFGKLNAHYGMVETQNRGTLHIHLLLWIENGLNATEYLEKMNSDETFRLEIIAYLNSIIKTGSDNAESDMCDSDIGKSAENPAIKFDDGYTSLLKSNHKDFKHMEKVRIQFALGIN